MALGPNNVLARIHGLILIALEDSQAKVVGWMPSHLTISDLEFQLAKESDGALVDERDLEANKLSDELANRGVEFHSVARSDVKIWVEQMERVKARAIWIGTASVEANDFASFPFKDSEASRWKADAAQRAKGNARRTAKTEEGGKCRWAKRWP